MRGKQALPYLGAFTVFVLLMILTVDISPGHILMGSGKNIGITAQIDLERFRKVYRKSFREEYYPAAAGLYVPLYSFREEEDAAEIADVFGMNVKPAENEEYFIFCTGGLELWVGKFVDRICFINSVISGRSGEIDDAEAADRALEFIAARFIDWNYQGIETKFSEGRYHVRFPETFEGIERLGLTTEVVLDECGNIMSCDFYFFEYEKIGRSNILTAEEAYMRLPVYDGGQKINVTRASLCYVFENSIIQPAYVFEGSTDGGESWESVILAVRYE